MNLSAIREPTRDAAPQVSATPTPAQQYRPETPVRSSPVFATPCRQLELHPPVAIGAAPSRPPRNLKDVQPQYAHYRVPAPARRWYVSTQPSHLSGVASANGESDDPSASCRRSRDRDPSSPASCSRYRRIAGVHPSPHLPCAGEHVARRLPDGKGIERLTRRPQGTFMAPSPQGSKNHLLAFSLGQILEFSQGRFGDLKVMPDVAGGDYKEDSRFA